MRIVAAQASTVRLTSTTRNSAINFDEMTATVLAIRTDVRRNGKDLVGFAFNSIGRYDHTGLLHDRFIPRLLVADPLQYADERGGIDPVRAWAIVMTNEKPGGHGERAGAVGLLDAALWDVAAKISDEPLWVHLGKLDAADCRAEAFADVYASGGHYRAQDDIAGLCEDIRRAMARGHRRFKIKIGGADLVTDLRRVESVLSVLEPNMRLAVDGNGTFALDTAMRYAEAFVAYPLMWLEEPVSPLDFESHRRLAELTSVPLAVGENLFSADDARNLLRYGGLRHHCDVLQFDISLSYGIVEYRRILDELARMGWNRRRCAPHAGHLLALNSVAGFGLGLAEFAMDETSLFGKLTSHVPVYDGRIRLSDAPGTGFEIMPAFSEIFGELMN